MNSLQSSDETIFAGALARPAHERVTYLDQACAGDTACRARIEALLRAHRDAAENFMTTAATAAPMAEPGIGILIGRYKLLQKIGEGGCGVVWMAEQQEPVVRRVAVKVIKLGMDTKEVIARFEAERQALALMEHPNIARVLDGGATVTGRPFFVMELVRGIAITKYCDEQNLSTRARLELFTQVCHAVQHAHQKGIIHRDLKPSNILVTLHDGKPVPKVIDFGIAKATQGRLTDATLFTAFEQFIGTPAYMSPEQAELSGLELDPRSDVYSLGVLLYELLTGQPPFDPKSLVSAGLDEIRRVIREVDPPRPSTRLNTLTSTDRDTVARQRGTLPAHLSTLLAGDLDWIVMRCLEKDRTRRYDSAADLQDDIALHLSDQPILARSPSIYYRMRKLIVRQRPRLVAAGIAATITLGLAVGGAAWERHERELAQTPAARLARETRDARTRQADTARRLGIPVEWTNSLGMVLRVVPPGEFQMGSTEADVKLLEGRNWFFAGWAAQRLAAEFPRHHVRLTRAFAMSAHEVTVGQYRAFVEATKYRTVAERLPAGGFGWTADGWQQRPGFNWNNPGYPQTDVHPVANLAWEDAAAFCRWLSAREEKVYRLPTEAEWEFACRGGASTAFCNGDEDTDLALVANIADQSLKSLHGRFEWARGWNDGFPFAAPVGKFAANAYGLHDMHGNVWEWCEDYYDPEYYAGSPAEDPVCRQRAPFHVFRGGGWDNYPGFCRSADRYSSHSPTLRTDWAGFRVVLSIQSAAGR